MMKQYVILDGIYVKIYGASSRVPDGGMEVEREAVDYANCMFVDGLWEERPAIAAPTVSLTKVVLFSKLPVGASVAVIDAETGAVLATVAEAAGKVTFQLVDPGSYILRATGPLPWLHWEGKVTC